MKRILVFLIAFTIVASISFTGCGEINRDSELRGFLTSGENNLSDTFANDSCSFSLLSDYISSWAKGNNLDIEYVSNHSIVLTNAATENSKDEPSMVLLCSVDTSEIQDYIKLISTATTSLLGPEEHGDISLIMAEKKNGRFIGMNDVPEKNLKSDNLIVLQNASNDGVLTSGPNNATAGFRTSSDTKESQYSKAYEIQMSIAEYTDPYTFTKDANYPNPINTVGSLLATEKSSGKLFDIASFAYEGHKGYTPYSAKAVVVVDSNNEESFMNRFNTSYENMERKFDDLEDDFVYTITEVDMPDKVLGDSTSDQLISLMYTLNTGICTQDEETGTIYASSYIKSISTKDGKLNMSIDIRARGNRYLNELSSQYETTAGLCRAKYTLQKGSKVWHSQKGSALVKFFTEQIDLDSAEDTVSNNISIQTYETDFVAKLNPKQNMIIYSFKKTNGLAVVYNITHFLDPSWVNTGTIN